jgi:hypothetical protein
MAPTCFDPFGPSSESIRQNLTKVTVFVEIISRNTSLKLMLCRATCDAAQHPVHTLQTEAHIATAQQQF